MTLQMYIEGQGDDIKPFETNFEVTIKKADVVVIEPQLPEEPKQEEE